ncbi:Flavodoxin domain-containing protein, partial [Dysosmobacter welbionis]
SLAPSAPPSPPGQMGAPWWRTSPPAFMWSRRSPFRSRSCGPPVSRPLPCGPARSARHGLRITPGPDWRSSSGILPMALPSRELPTRSDRSTGISKTPWLQTARAGSSWRWTPAATKFRRSTYHPTSLSVRSPRPSLWRRASPGQCASSTRSNRRSRSSSGIPSHKIRLKTHVSISIMLR